MSVLSPGRPSGRARSTLPPRVALVPRGGFFFVATRGPLLFAALLPLLAAPEHAAALAPGVVPAPATPGVVPAAATPGVVPAPATPGVVPGAATPGVVPAPVMAPDGAPAASAPGARATEGETAADDDGAEGATENTAASHPDPEACGAGALAAAAAADARLRERGSCDPADVALLAQAVQALRTCAGLAPRRAPSWRFPVGGTRPSHSIGGAGGSGFRAARPGRCYATSKGGHPAHDLFVDDPDRDWRDPRGSPFPALAVEDGRVLVASTGWLPGDPGKGGNYVMLYLPGRHAIAYYAHLDLVTVRPGDHVAAGEPLGTIGRTGLNAWPRRSPTHLHFGLWDVVNLRPMDPYKLLKAAR